jgi:cell division protein FtsQ
VRRGRWRWYALAVAVIIGVGSGVSWQRIRARPGFAIRSVRIVGTDRQMAADLRAVAAVPIGSNTWDLDLAAVRTRVLGHARIAAAEVRRRLPGGIDITVRERRAVAVVHVRGVSYGVDGRGRVFAPLPRERAGGLPRIRGVPVAPAGDGSVRVHAARALRRAAALVRAVDSRHHLREVRADRTSGLTARIAALGRVPIHFGWGRWREKSERLDAVLGEWVGREADLEAVSVAFRGQVVVRLRPGVPLERPAAAGRSRV